MRGYVTPVTDPQAPPPYPDQPSPYQSQPYQPVPPEHGAVPPGPADRPPADGPEHPSGPLPAQQSSPQQPTPYGFDDQGRVKRTKVSGVWIGLIAAAIVLILLIVFIAQNLNTVGLHFFGFYGKVSFGLALLVAAICGRPRSRPCRAPSASCNCARHCAATSIGTVRRISP